jgi:hypothetical protein
MSNTIATGSIQAACASTNRTRNANAMNSAGLSIPDATAVDGVWTTARDGSTTTRASDGRWWAGCSVPLLAGRSLLNSLESGSGVTTCLLHPDHAGIVRAARENQTPTTVLIVVHPDPAVIDHVLHEHDFSADIRAHRTSFFCGEQWADSLRQHFRRYPGLATPARFVRTKLTADETVDELIAEAQAVFTEVAVARAAQLDQLKSGRPQIASGRVLVVGRSAFQLWRPSFDELSADLPGVGLTAVHFDTDDALHGSPVALATSAAGCDAVFGADVFRADARGLVDERTAWVTWVTRPAIAVFDTAGRRDRLLLADSAWAAVAEKSGWPLDRTGLLAHPVSSPPPRPEKPRLGILADLSPINPPEAVKTFSSHRMLWEAIEAELLENPLTVNNDMAGYLTDRAGRMNLDPGELDRGAFCDGLIVPAYQRGLAALLVRSGLPVALYGSGWIDDPALIDHVAGDLRSEEDLQDAVARCSALVHALPIAGAHPIDALGRPVVRANPNEPFLQTAKRAMTGVSKPAPGTRGIGAALALAIRGGSRAQ